MIKEAMEGSSHFEALETLVRNTSLRIGAEFLQETINSDTSESQPFITHPDGTVMNYAGRRTKTFVTVLGNITLKRAYYTDKSGQGYYPRDEKLGLDKDSLSDGVKRMVGHTASFLD